MTGTNLHCEPRYDANTPDYLPPTCLTVSSPILFHTRDSIPRRHGRERSERIRRGSVWEHQTVLATSQPDLLGNAVWTSTSLIRRDNVRTNLRYSLQELEMTLMDVDLINIDYPQRFVGVIQDTELANPKQP